jgi:hypothetical protein
MTPFPFLILLFFTNALYVAGVEGVNFIGNASLVFGVARPQRNTSTILYLGSPPDADGCAAACAALSPQRCWMFSYYAASVASKLAGGCYGLTDPAFSPVPEDGVVSGSLPLPCRDDADCSFNGVCGADALCACTHSWRGARCETLNLLPAVRGSGFAPVDSGEPTTTWGGTVVPCGGGGFCMFASEITRHCGIAAWGQNSRVVMAQSAAAGGVYARTQQSWPVFSHEPSTALAPDGHVALFYTASPRNASCACVNGSTAPGDCAGKGEGGGEGEGEGKGEGEGSGVAAPTLLTFSANVSDAASWSAPQQLFPDYKGADLNFSPLIFANGSLLAMWRKWTGSGSRVFLARASDWRNASSYVQDKQELFPDIGAAGVEDCFLYTDPQGRFHAIFHHMNGLNTTLTWWLVAAGSHAFSSDGINWTFGGLAWGNSTTQGYDIHYTDGGEFHYTRLERPALIFGADGLPAALLSAAQYGTGRSASGSSGGDGAETIVQPIA